MAPSTRQLDVALRLYLIIAALRTVLSITHLDEVLLQARDKGPEPLHAPCCHEEKAPSKDGKNNGQTGKQEWPGRRPRSFAELQWHCRRR